MKIISPRGPGLAPLLVLATLLSARSEIKIVVERNDSDKAGPAFRFKNIPRPARGDAGNGAEFTVVAGRVDGNGGGVDKLHDGKTAREEDQPAECFFFQAGSMGGRLQVDLKSAIEVKQINTYSWHGSTRAPQVYRVFGRQDAPEKAGESTPESAGWKLIAAVDTRVAEGMKGGQYGVSIFDSAASMGKFQFLLFDIARTESDDAFGQTFFTEIDIVDAAAPALSAEAEEPPAPVITHSFDFGEGRFHFTFESTLAPDLTEWTDKELVPVVREWYPKLVEMLPGEGFQAPTNVTIVFKDNMGGTPAAAGGNRISCNIGWFRRNLKGEARGSVVHEMVHVVQQYGRARRNPTAMRTPGWVTEGIADYIRWFKYEPESHGAEITSRNIARAKYDASYRVTGNFLNWMCEKFDPQFVVKLNAAARDGNYREELWVKAGGKPLAELGDDWKKTCEEKIAAQKAKSP